MTEPQLTEDAVREIAARHELAEAACAPYQAVSDSLADIPALIRDWRAMRAENEQLKRGEFICQRCGLRKDAEFDAEVNF